MNEKDTITTTDKKEITTTDKKEITTTDKKEITTTKKPPLEPAANYTPELSYAEHSAIESFLCFCLETGLISEEVKESFSGAPKNNPDPGKRWYLSNDSIRSIPFVFPTLKEAIKLHNLIKSVKNGKAAEKTLHEIMYR